MSKLASGLTEFTSSIQYLAGEQERIQKAESQRIMQEQNAINRWEKFNEQREDHLLTEENAQAILDLRSQIYGLRLEVEALKQQITGIKPKGIIDYASGGEFYTP